VFLGGLRQNLHHWHMHSGVLPLNRDKKGNMRLDAPESDQTVWLTFGRAALLKIIKEPKLQSKVLSYNALNSISFLYFTVNDVQFLSHSY